MDINNLIWAVSTWILPVLFGIALHEAAHGYIAYRLGDTTAKTLGRLTLNPLKHIDPIGTVLVPALLLLIGSPYLFGWAKPIPVNTRNLKNPRRDMALVAIAGPLANFAMALGWAFIYNIGHGLDGNTAKGIIEMGYNGILFNIILMVFNLLPIPPLDGGRVLSSLLPLKYSTYLDKIEPYGFFIILGLMITGVLHIILKPLIIFVFSIVAIFL